MGLNKTKILGISITTNPKDEILEEIQKYLKITKQQHNKTTKNLIIVTPNPEQIVFAQRDNHFRDVLNQAGVAIPDGVGLVWASRFLGTSPIENRISGVDFMEDLIRIAAKEGYSIGLIGGWHGVAVKALECLQKKYPRLSRGWAIEPEGKSIEEITQKIDQTNTRIVFVGLGAPKQEYFIEKVNAPVVAMAVGGSFDIIAGRSPRAPFVLRTIGVEWLWRLIVEPWRWRRQLALFKFLWLVFLARHNSKSTFKA